MRHACFQESEEREGEELNLALRDEVLFFTLLGLRNAVGGTHMSGEESDRARALDMQAVIDASAAVAANEVEQTEEPSPQSLRNPPRRSYSDVELNGLRHSLKRINFSYTSYADSECRQLRDIFAIPEGGYLASLGGHCDAHFDGGKSGAIFFFSSDKRFIIKEVVASERRTLMALLPDYVEHMSHHPESLLPRILQLCSIQMYRRTLNFMVMENIFCTGDEVVKPSAVYDIKGSWVDRNAGGTRSRKPESGTYKDMDLNDVLYLAPSFRNRLRCTLEADTQFLAGNNIMDYSLLLGITNCPFVNGAKGGVQRHVPPSRLSTRDGVAEGLGAGAAQRGDEGSGHRREAEGGVPFWRIDNGGMAAAVIQGPGVYHLGMVDILQVYDLSKKLERLYKVYVLRKSGEGVSVMNPADYQKRFMRNLDLITADDEVLAKLGREGTQLLQPEA